MDRLTANKKPRVKRGFLLKQVTTNLGMSLNQFPSVLRSAVRRGEHCDTLYSLQRRVQRAQDRIAVAVIVVLAEIVVFVANGTRC